MSDIDSELQWFINKFSPIYSTLTSDKNGFIVASEFRRVSSSSDKAKFNIKKFRELMKSSVPDFATDNGMSTYSSKYAIRFNLSPVPARLFDKELLTDLVFDNLPHLSELRPNVERASRARIECWKIHKLYWLDVQKALTIYENTEEFKADFLPIHTNKQEFTITIKKLVYSYQILKHGWNDIQLVDPLKHQNYNDCFKTILMCFCKVRWDIQNNLLVYGSVTQRKRLDSIKANGINRQDVNRLSKGMILEPDDIPGRYAALNWLIKAAKQSQNDNVKKALNELEALLKIQANEVYTIVNRLSRKNDKKNTSKNNTQYIGLKTTENGVIDT
jgi:hypothetical protein